MRSTERREIEVYMAISSGLSSEDSRTTIQWTAAGILLPFVMVADGRQQSCPTPTNLPMPKISKLRILSSVYYKIIVLIHRIKTRYYRRQSVQCSASYVISFGSYLFRFEFQAPPTDPKRTVTLHQENACSLIRYLMCLNRTYSDLAHLIRLRTLSPNQVGHAS
jgi:hypothetical protein